ncbi:MAG: alpha-L-fucosidase [Bacteroidales bacterium]|nr:alpha-L-fucosidase [Bacteroidales bacterium]
MIYKAKIIALTMGCLFLISCRTKQDTPPGPYEPVPSAAQIAWQRMEYCGFLHFSLNTFTGKEWGYGNEDPALFNPVDFDAEQIASVAKEAGMKGLILTCKHHDGFCLWPSKFTEYSLKKSPWRNGKGDVVKEISEACARNGLKFGVYISPWDRNHREYGKPAYLEYFRNQLRELLTAYGPVFEVWFDGANGGTGWYGGADEERIIDRTTYYNWQDTWALVRRLQPGAVIFSDAGPDVRWIGNESGIAGDPCWARYTPHGPEGQIPAPGMTLYREGENGHRDGEFWMPAEADVSIRPGWFWHEDQDTQVRSPENLLDLYFKSVGRGAGLLLNIPPDNRGRISDPDVKTLMKFKEYREKLFEHDLALHSEITVSNVRGNSILYGGSRIADGNPETFWTCDDDVTEAFVILEFERPVAFNLVRIREYLPLGQRIDKWAIDVFFLNDWVECASGESVGNQRLWAGDKQITHKVRLRFSGAACPAVTEVSLFYGEIPRTDK